MTAHPHWHRDRDTRGKFLKKDHAPEPSNTEPQSPAPVKTGWSEREIRRVFWEGVLAGAALTVLIMLLVALAQFLQEVVAPEPYSPAPAIQYNPVFFAAPAPEPRAPDHAPVAQVWVVTLPPELPDLPGEAWIDGKQIWK